MSIEIGQTLPDVTLYRMGEGGPVSESFESLFKGQKVAIFGLPGAFTPTCSESHLPGFIVLADKLKNRGLDRIICLSVNDAFVMSAWGKAQNAEAIDMLADGNADFVRALGLDLDLTSRGMGVRARRFALIANDGKVSWVKVEAPGQFEVSSAEAVLDALEQGA
ncbi:MAG: peroxiredoxin [Saccharospirillum sp.]|nr:peroxiredoxin [Saccharospirillum sp.]